MIQDIAPSVLDNQYSTTAVAEDKDNVICTLGGELLLVPEGEGWRLPRVSDFAEDMEFTYLLNIDGDEYYMPELARQGQSAEDVPEGAQYCGIRTIRDKLSKVQNFAALTGKHLIDWYRDNRCCGRCGSKMEHSETERAMVCPECGYTSYPRIMPAVIVACKKGDKLLVSKYSKGYKHYALIAGFTEIGETLEETVYREVFEETGIRVKNIRYYKSQPWGIANDILVGYVCEAEGDDEIVIDENELQEAGWVTADELDIKYDDYSLTNELMWKFKCGEI
ncbi:MAG: NAD(+) diphosphatase [Firmicutes bacterium]|nr:NAD(+) diphosphatase [Bacillota bacterium]